MMTNEPNAGREGIEPCPFCGSGKVAAQSPPYYYVTCLNCHAYGPDGASVAGGIYKWNGAKR